MAEKIWAFGNITDSVKTPYDILFEYASQLKEDTEGLIEGIVTELITESSEMVIYALYLVVPELKNYSYRLIEVTQPNVFTPYPVKMKLFGPWQNFAEVENDIAEEDFDKTLREYISHPGTKRLLGLLKNQIQKHKQHKTFQL